LLQASWRQLLRLLRASHCCCCHESLQLSHSGSIARVGTALLLLLLLL
jgi:hypothetical protein